ncbi:uncharacterized protein LOC141910524 [Tubulanus polymorphus]|uniref:uncharacterized protein LOC141910524 n=1 Tax=Tubulanus polymorphus TaxID=672921 RepID=UPI003DA67812
MCTILGIDKTRTTAYHPMGNGQVENLNKTLKSTLTVAVNDKGTNWDDHLPACLMAFRSSIQMSTQETPFYLTFGEEMVLPIDIMVGNPNPSGATKYGHDLTDRLDYAHHHVRDRLQAAQRRQKLAYDRFAKRGGYQEGHRVWLLSHFLKQGEASKFHHKWKGPYTVIERVSEVRVSPVSGQKKTRVVHFNDMKLCYGDIRKDCPKEIKPTGRLKRKKTSSLPVAEEDGSTDSDASSENPILEDTVWVWPKATPAPVRIPPPVAHEPN